MRTTFVIGGKLMADASLATGSKTKREMVEPGLEILLRLRQQSDTRQLRGEITWEGDLGTMRRDK